MRAPVLVVDDDADIREVIALTLEAAGFDSLLASNGVEALELLRGARPCAILLDLMMPEMDGWTFRAEQIKDEQWRTIPVVLLSGGADVEAAGRALHAAATLRKPVELQQLLAVVRAHC